ncbi:ATP-binding protein [Actinoallomurus sp. NPDC052274]|uniref:sensor histidine kinase n=1 Tax=Actinoallomurus sp. NPDC052274 TaxID=3155420 RepID=UPI00341591DA
MIWLAEQLRPVLESLEAGEGDPDKVTKLWQLDHGIARMRERARSMRILADRDDEGLAGQTTALVDVIRTAQSAIEFFTRVNIDAFPELAVVDYAAADVASLLAALLDNATRYSRAQVHISAHLLEAGQVLVRIDDSGPGFHPRWLAAVNAMFAGPCGPVDEQMGKQTGLPVAHRLARRHGIFVRLACRPPHPSGASGTIVTVVLPPSLLCAIPAPAPAPEQGSASGETFARPAETNPLPGHLTVAPDPSRAVTDGGTTSPDQAVHGLPRRQRTSVRAQTPLPTSPDPPRHPPAADARAFAADLTDFASGLGPGREPDRPRPDDDAGPVPS